MTTLIIDEEFKNILPPLSEDEHLALEENITQWGSARDPILVWKEENIIIDGHHRHSVCEAYGLPFEIKFISFNNRGDAIEWAYRNQLGRRNLAPQKMRYLYGKIAGSIVSEKGNSKDKQVEALAKQQGVSKRTIYNSEKYAEKVDTLPTKEKAKVLSGERDIQIRSLAVTGKIAKLSHPYRTATRELRRIVKEFEIISDDSTTGQYIATKMTRIKNNLEEAIDAINQCEPVEECDKCHGKTCNHCYGTGFLSRAARESRDK